MKLSRSIFIVGLLLWTHNLLSAQNVGIGTSNPVTELHINDTNNDGDVGLRLTTSDAELIYGFNPSNEGIFGTISKHDLWFRTSDQNRMLIDSDGLVGIGTTSPSELLEVRNGSILISGIGQTNSKGLIFSETDNPTYGWIYDGLGSGSNNQLQLREFIGTPSDIMTIKGNGRIGFGTENPSAALDLSDGSLILSNLGSDNDNGILFGEGSNPVYGWIYDGDGVGADNELHLREYTGTESDVLTVKGDGRIMLNSLASSAKRELFVSQDGTIVSGPASQYIGAAVNASEDFTIPISLRDGIRLKRIVISYRDNTSSGKITFRLSRRNWNNTSGDEVVTHESCFTCAQSSLQTISINIPTSFGVIDNDAFTYKISASIFNGPFDPNGLFFGNYKFEYNYE